MHGQSLHDKISRDLHSYKVLLRTKFEKVHADSQSSSISIQFADLSFLQLLRLDGFILDLSKTVKYSKELSFLLEEYWSI